MHGHRADVFFFFDPPPPTSKVEGCFYVNDKLATLMIDELRQFCGARGVGGFLPAIKQIANVAALPGIVGVSILDCLSDFISKAKERQVVEVDIYNHCISSLSSPPPSSHRGLSQCLVFNATSAI